MSSAQQVTFMNQRSFGLIIGQAFGGGFFAGQISTAGNGIATHNLVVGPLSTAQSTLAWKNADTAAPGADSLIDGPQNTADMVADGNSTVYPCAHFCNNAVIGGFSDWYMPAKNELDVCYFNLKPGTQANDTSIGTNSNAVPARASNYTSGNPAQTSAAAFQTGGAEPFAITSYWSSTEPFFDPPIPFSIQRAYAQLFTGGGRNSSYKTTSHPVRCIRRVAV